MNPIKRMRQSTTVTLNRQSQNCKEHTHLGEDIVNAAQLITCPLNVKGGTTYCQRFALLDSPCPCLRLADANAA